MRSSVGDHATSSTQPQPSAAGMLGWLLAALLAGAHSSASAQTDPGSSQAQARACFDAGQAAYLAGRLEEARRGFECAYAQLPSAELAWNLARVCERTGAVEDGVRYYREYLAHARVSTRERQKVEARIKALLDLQARQSQTLKVGPEARAALGEEARTFFQRGVKLYRAGQYAAAAAAFTAVLQMSKAPELHYNLALASERLGAPLDALDHYRAYLDALPQANDRVAVEQHIAELRAQLP
jgi:tetratricopeptide (TPR) repeat protein